jgi:hypothetical protein
MLRARRTSRRVAQWEQMTNVQLYLAIGIPILANAALFGLLLAYMNARFDGMNESISRRFDAVNQRFDGVDRRFDDMRDLWRAGLHRVEEVLDARLKHIEQEHP